MRIYIPTRGRVTRQDTWDVFPPPLRALTTLVAPAEEHAAHTAHGRQVLSPPDTVQGISATRQWIAEHHLAHNPYDPRFIMTDDDHGFLIRKSPDSWQLRATTPEELARLFRLLFTLLQRYAAVGLSSRQGNNRHFPEERVENTRLFNLHGWRADILAQHQIRFDVQPLMEDFHATLSLLRRGYPNVLVTDHAWGQRASNAPGGCSLYRDAELQRQAALALKDKHPDFVRVVEKETKTGWEGIGKRTDVVISWKKAYDAGVAQYGTQTVVPTTRP